MLDKGLRTIAWIAVFFAKRTLNIRARRIFPVYNIGIFVIRLRRNIGALVTLYFHCIIGIGIVRQDLYVDKRFRGSGKQHFGIVVTVTACQRSTGALRIQNGNILVKPKKAEPQPDRMRAVIV